MSASDYKPLVNHIYMHSFFGLSERSIFIFIFLITLFLSNVKDVSAKMESVIETGNPTNDPLSPTIDHGQTPALSKHEMYKDMYPITLANFTSRVMKSKDPWILVFHDGSFSKTWKTMAVSVRGVAWIGIIDQSEMKLIEHLKLSPDNLPASLVYPYGSYKTKEQKREVALTAQEARAKAVASIPNMILKVSTDIDNSIEDFIMDSLMTSPSRFPALILTYDDTPSDYFKALAIRLDKYVNFGIMHEPTEEDLAVLGLADDFDVPSFIAILAVHSEESEQPMFSAIQYNEEDLGDMDYPNLLRFLVSVNSQYRHMLAGDNMSNDRTIATMSDVIDIESQRFNITKSSKSYSSKKEYSSKVEL